MTNFKIIKILIFVTLVQSAVIVFMQYNSMKERELMAGYFNKLILVEYLIRKSCESADSDNGVNFKIRDIQGECSDIDKEVV